MNYKLKYFDNPKEFMLKYNNITIINFIRVLEIEIRNRFYKREMKMFINPYPIIHKELDKQFKNIDDESAMRKAGYVKIDKIRKMTWNEVVEFIHE